MKKFDIIICSLIVLSVILLVVLLGLILGLMKFSFISDWEYEHYYYVEIRNNSTENYSVIVPLPSGTDAQMIGSGPKYFNNYINNLKIKKGNCTFEVIEYNSKKFLQINGSSNISIYSSFTLWDSNANISIEKVEFNETMIHSNSSNISLIIDSRAVRKTNEKETWDLFYSVAIKPDMSFPILTKQTWKEHLSESYFLHPEVGWNSYPIKEETRWNTVLIR